MCRVTRAALRAAWSKPAAAIIADGPMQVRLRVREQLMQGCIANQADRQRRRVVAAQPAGHGRRSPSPNCARGSRQPKTGPPTSPSTPTVRDDPASDRCWGQVHRARSSDGRSDGQADGGQGRLVEHPTIPQRGGRLDLPDRREPGTRFRCSPARIHAYTLAREYRYQDGIRLGFAVLPDARQAPGHDADPSDALV